MGAHVAAVGEGPWHLMAANVGVNPCCVPAKVGANYCSVLWAFYRTGSVHASVLREAKPTLGG